MASAAKAARGLTQLFVYRLRWTVDRESLIAYFSRFGEVKFAEVSFDEKTGVSKMFGKVRMSSDDEMKRILDFDQHKIEGSLVRVKIDEPLRRGGSKTTGDTLAQPASDSVTDTELQQQQQ